MKLPVKVEKRHIDNAIEKDSHHCMIADAIREHYPWATYVLVDLQSIRFSDLRNPLKKVRFKYFTPPKAQLALLKFDQGEKVTPFSFELHNPIVKEAGWFANNVKPITKSKEDRWKPKKGHRPNPNRLTAEREFGLRRFVK